MALWAGWNADEKVAETQIRKGCCRGETESIVDKGCWKQEFTTANDESSEAIHLMSVAWSRGKCCCWKRGHGSKWVVLISGSESPLRLSRPSDVADYHSVDLGASGSCDSNRHSSSCRGNVHNLDLKGRNLSIDCADFKAIEEGNSFSSSELTIFVR